MAHKIYVTGCAKSGTTLLCRLMTAFQVKVFVDDEAPVDFLYHTQPYEVVKRNSDSFLSSEDFTEHNMTTANNAEIQREWARQIDYLDWRGVKILHIKRKKADVLKSENGYVSESRYNAVLYQEQLLKNKITLTINYEDLIAYPNAVQLRVADAFNLTIKDGRAWSAYHLWYEPSEAEYLNGQYRVRPIGSQLGLTEQLNTLLD
jgi:hypothetical protein